MKKHVQLIASTVAALSLLSGPVARAADASQGISTGFASMAASPLASVEGGPLNASGFFVLGSAIVVLSLGAVVGDAVSVVVQNAVDGSKAVIRVSASTARQVGVSVGSSISVVTESTGYALLTSGKLLAFVPNAMGQELLHQTKLSK